jgi:hypothetical protein
LLFNFRLFDKVPENGLDRRPIRHQRLLAIFHHPPYTVPLHVRGIVVAGKCSNYRRDYCIERVME